MTARDRSAAKAAAKAAQATARDAWLDWWDVRDGEGPVVAAMPWRLLSREPPPARDSLFLMRGLHTVAWLGYDPRHGLVQAVRPWDPDGEARPPLPSEGWQPCNGHFFTWPGVVDAWRKAGLTGHNYRELPMPRHAGNDGARDIDHRAAVQARFDVQDEPFGRFLIRCGIPRGAMLMALADFRDAPFVRNAWLPRSLDVTRAALWLAGNEAGGGITAETARTRRQQALEAMPCFAHAVTRDVVTGRVVDPGLPLVPYLADRMGCQASTVRILAAAAAALRRARPGWVPPQHGGRRSAVLMLLDGMPRPVLGRLVVELDRQGWRSLEAMSELVGVPSITSMARHLGSGIRPAPDDAPGGAWGWIGREPDRWAHFRDVAGEFGRDLLWPLRPGDGEAHAGRDPWGGNALFSPEETRRMCATVALVSLGAARLGAVLDAHMQGALRRAAERGSGGGIESTEWAPLALPVTAGTGQTLRFLATDRELAAEGVHMGHCVGDYDRACLEGRCAIMSIGNWEGEDWRPSSTVEIRRDGGDGLEVAQHMGPGNAEPPDRDVMALGEWMDGVREGVIPLDDTALPVIVDTTSIAGALGGDWDSPPAHAARWDRWRRILDLRQGSLGAFLHHAVGLVMPPDDTGPLANECRALVADAIAVDSRKVDSMHHEAVPLPAPMPPRALA